MYHRLLASSVAVSMLCLASDALAQVGWSGGASTGGGVYGAPTGQPYGAQPTGPAQRSSNLEIGSLYVTATAWGLGTGVWIDAEAGIDDPGLIFVPPLLLGVGAATGVFFLDQPPYNNRGIPASISTGFFLGAGEGLAIWSTQYTRSKEANQWGFKELARTTFISSTIGGAAGAAAGFLQEPSPKSSLLINTSALLFGTSTSMIVWGAAPNDSGFGKQNDYASLGGLIGFNVGLVGGAALSTFWIPTYKQLLAIWAGAGIGAAATTPVYLFYIGSDKSAHHGLIVQGIGTLVGAGIGAALFLNDTTDVTFANNSNRPNVMLTGVGLMPVPGGTGAQLTGLIF